MGKNKIPAPLKAPALESSIALMYALGGWAVDCLAGAN